MLACQSKNLWFYKNSSREANCVIGGFARKPVYNSWFLLKIREFNIRKTLLYVILAAERRYSLGRGVKSKATETPVFQYIRNVNPIGVVQKKQIMVHLHTMNMMF